MVEEMQDYERKWHSNDTKINPERLLWQAYVQEENGHSWFSLVTGDDSILK
jgi:hypothetical protein